MPDEQNGDKTLGSIWGPARTFLLALRWLQGLTWKQRFHAAAVTLAVIAGGAAYQTGKVWFLSTSLYRSPWFPLGSAIVAILAMLVALKLQQTAKNPSRWLLYLIVVVVIVTVGFGAMAVMRHRKASRFHSELKSAGLPADLYDYQGQLTSLTIYQRALPDLDWLDAPGLTDFKIVSGGLNSINGLHGVPNLQSLEIDLRDVPLGSLVGISSLHHLHTLALQNIGRAKTTLALESDVLQQLTKLDLDFERSKATSLPDLTKCQRLNDLTLNLRSTTILGLPDLSGLPELRSISLFLDSSQVQNLKPVAKLALQSLVLSLDGTQLGMLSDLKSGSGVNSLDIKLTTPPNDKFPDLSAIPNLNILALRMPGTRGTLRMPRTGGTLPPEDIHVPDRTPIPDITYLTNLSKLAITAKGSEIRELPTLGRLTGLLKLDLDLEMSGVQMLPDISRLHNLQELTINIRNTAITDLPDFSQFPKLHELNLVVANSQIHSLRGIQSLKSLHTMTLDITGTSLQNIDAIAQIDSLKKLVLRLQWRQVGTLPDLAPLKNLETLELHIDNWWDSEKLPELSNLANLTRVYLGLADSETKDLPQLLKVAKIEELHLDLRDSRISMLPDLRQLEKLHSVVADIRHSDVALGETQHLRSLEALTIDRSFSSLESLPNTVRTLIIGPCSDKDKRCSDQ